MICIALIVSLWCRFEMLSQGLPYPNWKILIRKLAMKTENALVLGHRCVILLVQPSSYPTSTSSYHRVCRFFFSHPTAPCQSSLPSISAACTAGWGLALGWFNQCCRIGATTLKSLHSGMKSSFLRQGDHSEWTFAAEWPSYWSCGQLAQNQSHLETVGSDFITCSLFWWAEGNHSHFLVLGPVALKAEHHSFWLPSGSIPSIFR